MARVTDVAVEAGSAVLAAARNGAGRSRARVSLGLGRARRNPKSSAATAVVAVAALGLILAMVLADGFRATTYDLRSAGVWVVNRELHRFGRVNARLLEQDGLGSPAMAASDVLQDGDDVFVRTDTGLQRVSPATLEAEGDPIPVAPTSTVAIGGGRMAVIDGSGKVRVAATADATTLAALDEAPDGTAKSEESDEGTSGSVLEAGTGAELAVGRYGDVVVASPQHRRVTVMRRGAHEAETIDADLDGDVQVSVAGRQPVALHGSTLVLPGGEERKVPGANPKLQLPSDDTDHVLVATDEGIASFQIDGGDHDAPTMLSRATSTPSPARPVNVHGCTYAAWAGPEPKVLHVCGSRRQELAYPAGAQLQPGSELAWQVNGDYAVLNDLSTGLVLAVSDGQLIKADQWDTQEIVDQGPPGTETAPAPNFDAAKNKTPEATPDDYGARAGRPSILPVLDNDKDADGDVLAIRQVDGAPDGTVVQVVRGGTAVQVTPAGELPAGAKVTFSYRISDGWPETDASCAKCEATVTVTVADPEKNREPELKNGRPPAHISVGPKARTTYPVLDDWIDPDGDALLLSEATIDATVADVSAQTDGVLTYVDRSAVPGEHSVAVKVTDVPLVSVVPMTAEGTVSVTVQGVNTPPVARSDYASTAPGVPVVVWPLRNDTDADGDDLTFTLVPAGGVPPEARQNADGSVTVSPTQAGTLQFGYEVNDGHNPAVTARIRVDVMDPTAQPPSAGMDLVVLPAPPASGAPSSRAVDLLANDVSPSGNVLVVTRVRVDGQPAYGLKLQLLEHRRLSVSYNGRLQKPVTLSYTLSDGKATTTGTVVVVSAASDVNLPPVPVDDDVDVRAGDVVSVPVLANDIDPEGASLHLRGAELTRGEGIVFLSGQRIRFLAPAAAGTVTITYTVGDDPVPGAGNEATGRLTVTVRSSTANAAPIPPPVDARVVAGSTVKITVPLAGIDPDGDSVTLLGLGLEGNVPQAPKLGRITAVGLDTFTYQAFDGKAGTDVFRYRVADTGGPGGKPIEAEGVIRVGVAASDGANGAPTPEDDWFTMRAGGAHLDVLSNDFDPDGDAIALVSAKGPSGLAVDVKDGRIVADLPESDQVASYALTYRVEDEAGLTADANVTVTVDPNAAGSPPIARDDLAEPGSDAKTARVTVEVLKNDEDPDGDPDEIDVDVAPGTRADATVDQDRRLSIAVTDRTQLLAYRITDGQRLTATAIVRVPPAGDATDLPPVMRPDARAVSTGERTGGPVEVKLDTVAMDPEGKPLRLDGANLTAVNGTAEVIDATTFRFTPDTYDVQTGAGPRGRGAASVSFIVSDAEAGRVGQRAVLTLPVDVELEAPALPRWTAVSPLDVSVYHGDDPASFDLRRAVADDDTDPSKLVFELVDGQSAIDGIKVEIRDGHILTASVSGAPPAVNTELGTVQVQVTDDDDLHAVAPATIPVRTVATNRSLPGLATFSVEAESGKPTEQDILEGASNPFDESVEEALELDPASVRTMSGKGTAVARGTRTVVFTPSEDPASVGTSTVSFEVVDIVGRRIPGTVTYTVSSVPGAPGAPSVRQVSASSVEVAWAAADKHGKDITKYTVRDNLGRSTTCSTELFCLIEGLTPGTTYTFEVVATNERGDGPASTPSPQIRPDECAAAPTNVQLTFDPATNPKAGGQLVASWEKPANKGTPIEGYVVQVSPASTSPLTEPVRSTSVTLSGLTNGTPHTVTVRAKNQCDGGGLGEPADSNPEIPAGVPDAPTSVVAVDAADPTGGRIELTWTPPTAAGAVSDHGDRVAEYTITATEGAGGFGSGGVQTYKASDLRTNANGTVTANLSVNRNLDAYRFTVAATNKAGSGAASAASAPQTARGKPKAPDLLSASFDPNSTTNDGRVTVTYRESTDAGDDRITYLYRYGGIGWTEVPDNVHGFTGAQHSFTVGGLGYGQSYTFQLKARNDSYESPEDTPVGTSVSGGGASSIYGMFDAPSLSCSSPVDTVTCNYSANNRRGNDITLVLSGSPLNFSTGSDGSRSQTVGFSQSGTQNIRSQDSHGRSKDASASWGTPPPPRRVELYWKDGAGDRCQGCVWVGVRIYNFAPGTYYVNVRNSSGDWSAQVDRDCGTGGGYCRRLTSDGTNGQLVGDHVIYYGSSDPMTASVDGVQSSNSLAR